MALSQRKIPILTGVNDVPSSDGNPNHPNDSLLCKNYNDLIDNELTTIQTAVNNIPTTTDDLTEGTTNKFFNGKTTDDLTEGTTNKYYGETLFNTSLATKTTDDLTEGSTNKYYADSLARNALSATVGESGVTYDATTGVFNFSNIQAGISDLNDFTTDDLAEGLTNKYFANELARQAISVTGNGSYDPATGIITINNAIVNVDHITSVDNGNGSHTLTYWGDVAETNNLGSITLYDGISPQVTVLTQASYDALGTPDANTFYVING